MPCAVSKDVIDAIIGYHGHYCPGLAIGIRAAELALRELGQPEDADMLVVSETDMCGVDAIQWLTGCTLGKGDFMLRDWGKMAFTFYDRRAGRGLRAVLRPEARSGGDASAPDSRETVRDRLMDLDLDEVFAVSPVIDPPARRAAVLQSLRCESCGEMVMESRSRRFGGKILCIPCFGLVEQKI